MQKSAILLLILWASLSAAQAADCCPPMSQWLVYNWNPDRLSWGHTGYNTGLYDPYGTLLPGYVQGLFGCEAIDGHGGWIDGCWGGPGSPFGAGSYDEMFVIWDCTQQELTGVAEMTLFRGSTGAVGSATIQGYSPAVFVVGSNLLKCDGTFTGDTIVTAPSC